MRHCNTTVYCTYLEWRSIKYMRQRPMLRIFSVLGVWLTFVGVTVIIFSEVIYTELCTIFAAWSSMFSWKAVFDMCRLLYVMVSTIALCMVLDDSYWIWSMVFDHLCDLFSLNLLVVAYEFLAIRFVYHTHLNLNTVYVHYYHNFLFLPTFF